MKACDVCLSPNTSVVDSREEDGAYVRRRRKCNACQARWTTYEVTEERYKAMRSATTAMEKLTHAQREIASAIDALREAVDPASELEEVA